MSCNHLSDCPRCGRVIDDLERENAELRRPIPADIIAANEHITSLEKQNAELRRDKERLDWLENNGYRIEVYITDPATVEIAPCRDAIDTAMKK